MAQQPEGIAIEVDLRLRQIELILERRERINLIEWMRVDKHREFLREGRT
jgi:hypothetical protein